MVHGKSQARRGRSEEGETEMSTTPKLMDAGELEGIRARAEAATPGPWDYDEGEWECNHAPGDDDEYPVHSEKCDDGLWISPPGVSKAFTEDCGEYCALSVENAAFIAHARADVPALLAHIAALTAENTRLASERDKYECLYTEAVNEDMRSVVAENARLVERVKELEGVLRDEHNATLADEEIIRIARYDDEQRRKNPDRTPLSQKTLACGYCPDDPKTCRHKVSEITDCFNRFLEVQRNLAAAIAELMDAGKGLIP